MPAHTEKYSEVVNKIQEDAGTHVYINMRNKLQHFLFGKSDK